MKGLFSRKKIKIARNLGEKIKSARKHMQINLEDAERDTKIAIKYLLALEHSDYSKLPADVYVYGFLKRYAAYLNINKEEIIKHYVEEKSIFDSLKNVKKHSDQKNKNLLKPKADEKWLKIAKFVVTPELAIGFFISIVVICLLGYIWFQVKSFAAAPPLTVNNPEAEIVVSMDRITIAGKTDATANLTINNQFVAVDSEGNFSQEVQLSKGINAVEITAKNKANKESKKTVQILSK